MIKLKKLNKKTEKIFKESEVAAIMENMNDNIKLLAEGQMALNERFDGLENRFDGLENRFDGLENRFDGLENRFDKLEKETRAGFNMIMDYLKRIDEEVIGIKSELESTREEKVDWDAYSLLEKRVEKAEEQIEKVKALLKLKKAQN